MKKFNFLLIALMLYLATIPTFAENWVQLEAGYFADASSQTNYYVPNLGYVYSIWTKSYNDGSVDFQKDYDYFNVQVLVDCNSGKYSVKSGKTYLKNGSILPKSISSVRSDNLEWANFTQNSKSEVLYSYACRPNIKKQEQNSILSPNNPTPEDIYKSKVKSMLYIEAPNSKGGSQGSGVILNSDGTFVTCFHVIAKADYIKVRTINGEEYYVDGFKYINPLDDIAILTLNTNKNDFTPISLPYKTSQVGEKVYTISSPRGFEFSFSDGMISQFSHENIQFSAPSSPGSSGGALLNNRGDLLGIISWGRTDGQNINFATPNSYFMPKMYNKPIKNVDNKKWSEFVLSNAGEEQYKLTVQYAFKWADYVLLYQYLKPYVDLSNYPHELYALAGYVAIYAYSTERDKGILQDAISWYEKSLSYNIHEELSSLALFSLYSLNFSENESKIEKLFPIAMKYPTFQSLIMEGSKCKENDNKCFEDLGGQMVKYISDMTSEIYFNNTGN